jgi:HSP20 family protein
MFEKSLGLFSRIGALIIRKNFPAIDIYEHDTTLTIDAALPGVNQNDITVVVRDGKLVISGKIKKETEIDDEYYYRKEVKNGYFEREVSIPETYVAGRISAPDVRNGMVRIEIKK